MRHALLLLTFGIFAVPSAAQEAGGGDVTVAQDLLAVLHLRGKVCESVASHEQLGEADYLVVCSDGPRYRIYIEGDRVEIEDR